MNKRRFRLTNISKGHIGFSRPTSLFLRRPQESGIANLASAVIFEDQVDDRMREMAANKLITIELVKDGEEQVEKVAERIPVKKAKRPKHKKVKLEITDNSKGVKFEGIKDFIEKGGLDVVKGATDSVEIKTEEPSKTKIIDPSPAAQVATVGSSESGAPVVKDPESAASPTVTASEEEMGTIDSGVYSIADLESMKMSDVRGIVSGLGLNIKSVKKEDLVTAILKKQGNKPGE